MIDLPRTKIATKADEIIRSLESEARTALFYKELCIVLGEDKNLLCKITKRNSTSAFNLIQIGTCHNLIMCLNRIWDKADSNRKSLCKLIELFQKHDWLSEYYIDDAKTWPGCPENNQHKIKKYIKAAKEEYQKFREIDFEEPLKALTEFRNNHLAHKLDRKTDTSFNYGHLYNMTDKTYEIIDILYLCITGISTCFADDEDSYQKIYKKSAEAFGKDLASGL
ncbi:MAG: hypothetical protein ACLFR0_09555 [Alphaproteobacteria bacterium]